MTDELKIIANGKKVSFHYQLTVDGKIVDSSFGAQPLDYTHGQQALILGLENQMTGMGPGDKKSIRVSPEDGYGPVDPNAFIEVPKSKLPPEANKPGIMLTVSGPNGKQSVLIKEIREETAVIDFNHPLAGKDLDFEVEILTVE